MLKKLILLAFLPLLMSCSILKKAERVNAKHFVKQELEKIIDDLETAEPTGVPMKSLYLVDLAGKYETTLASLSKQATDGSEEALLIAQLRGDGESLIKWSKDKHVVAQGHLLMGNWVEAKRMTLNDPATDAMIYLASGDTLRAIQSLEFLIVQTDVDRMIRLNGARQLCEIVPDSYLGLNQIMKLTANPWEQFTSNTLLDFHAGREMRYDPKDARQELFVKFLEAKRSGNTDALKDATRLMRDRGERLEKPLRELRSELLKHQLYPEALEIHKLLPTPAQREYPYSLLEEYAYEISLLQSYEQPQQGEALPSTSVVSKRDKGTSFRSLWGDVRNVDNWAMEYSSTLASAGARQTIKLSTEDYNALREQLQFLIPSR